MSAAPADQAAIRAEVERSDERIATLRARAAIAGYELHIIDAGNGTTSTFVITRWGLQRGLRDEAAVEAFLAQVGAR